MRRKRVLSQKRPAAGGEARKRASFLLIESASCDTKTRHRDAHCAPEKMAANAAAFQHGNVPRNIFCADGNCRQHFWTGGRNQGYV